MKCIQHGTEAVNLGKTIGEKTIICHCWKCGSVYEVGDQELEYGSFRCPECGAYTDGYGRLLNGN